MKFLKILLLLASCLALSANAKVYDCVEKFDTPEILESKKDSQAEVTLKLPKAKRVPYAAIIVTHELKEFSKSNASLTLFIDEKEVGAATIYNKKGDSASIIIVNRAIRDAVKAGKEKINVKILMRGVGQSVVKIKSIGIKMVCDEKHFRNSFYIRPIFSGDEVTAESVFPLGNEKPQKPATAKLLFNPTEILDAYTFSSGKKVELVKDKDFKINGNTIEFMPNSAIKIIPYNEMYADKKEDIKQCQNPFMFDNIKKFAFFKEGDWFHKHMVYISYKHALSDEKVGENFDEKILPNTLRLLEEKKPVRIVLFGDSISYGANASGKNPTEPYSPTWGDFVAQELSKYYKTPVVFFNRALGGMNSTWGANEVENLVSPDKPDLVIVAFGMNDRVSKEKFKDNLQTIILGVRKVNPAAEIILVNSMMANPLWHTFTVHDDYSKLYAEMETKGVAIADVRAMHQRLLKQKRFIDMTGNNVNHPNDFLIRVYAQTILQKLIPSMSK